MRQQKTYNLDGSIRHGMRGAVSGAVSRLTRATFFIMCMFQTIASGGEPLLVEGILKEIRGQTESPSVVEARLLTDVLGADGMTEALRARLTEFLDAFPGNWETDPITGRQVDALRVLRIRRDGQSSVRCDTEVQDVFVAGGDRWTSTIVWTEHERLFKQAQNSEWFERNKLDDRSAARFKDQIDRGIMPWDLSRSAEGGYYECIEIATRLIAQDAAPRVTTGDESHRIESVPLGVSIEYHPHSYAVSSVRFPLPNQAGTLNHSFTGQLATDPRHPEFWISYRNEGGAERRTQTVRFRSVRVSTAAESDQAFDRDALADRVQDRVTGVVYRSDGSVDEDATQLQDNIRTATPTQFFDLVDTDEGPVVVAHKPGGVSARTTIVTLGVGLALVGAIAAARSRAG